MPFIVDLDDGDNSITLSNGRKIKIDYYDFSIVVGWIGDSVKTKTIDGQKFVINEVTNAKARVRSY